MSKSKVVMLAEARIAELEATIAAAAAQKVAAEAAIAPAVKRRAALAARLSKMLLLTEAGGQPNSEPGGIHLTSLDTITLGYSHDGDGQTAAKLAEAMLSGKARINAVGGISYTLRGFLRRSKVIDKRRLWAVDRAKRRREAAQAALKRAWKAEREAYVAAFEVGDKPDEKLIGELVAKKLTIGTRPAIDAKLSQAAWQAENDLRDAQAHLAWAKATNPDKGVCPCYTCQRERREAQEAKVEAERIAALPTGMVTCPHCNRRHRASLDERTTTFTDVNAAELREKWGVEVKPYERVTVPRGYCHKSGKWILLASQWAANQAKAAKAAKRHPKFRTVTFLCTNPECESTATSPVEDGYVTCDTCEVEYDVERVKLVKAAA